MARNVRAIKKREEAQFEITVEEAVNQYLQTSHVKRLSPRTQQEYHIALHSFADWSSTHSIVQDKKTKKYCAPESDESQVMLHHVNDQVVYCFLEHVKATHPPRRSDLAELSTYTLNKYSRVIKTFLNWCSCDNLYSQHVNSFTVQRIENPGIIETIIEVFTSEQIDALFEACHKEESEHLQLRGKAILALLFDTGIRAGELVTLKIGHVYLGKDPHIRVLGKGSKWGEIGLGKQATEHIQRYIRTFREPTIEHAVRQKHKDLSDRQLKETIRQTVLQEPLIVSRSAKPLTTSGLDRIFTRLGYSAAIEEVRCSPHTCRHTFASLFMRNNGNIYTLSQLLRHSSVKVTEEYLKSLRQAEARIGAKSVLDNL